MIEFMVDIVVTYDIRYDMVLSYDCSMIRYDIVWYVVVWCGMTATPGWDEVTLWSCWSAL